MAFLCSSMWRMKSVGAKVRILESWSSRDSIQKPAWVVLSSEQVLAHTAIGTATSFSSFARRHRVKDAMAINLRQLNQMNFHNMLPNTSRERVSKACINQSLLAETAPDCHRHNLQVVRTRWHGFYVKWFNMHHKYSKATQRMFSSSIGIMSLVLRNRDSLFELAWNMYTEFLRCTASHTRRISLHSQEVYCLCTTPPQPRTKNLGNQIVPKAFDFEWPEYVGVTKPSLVSRDPYARTRPTSKASVCSPAPNAKEERQHTAPRQKASVPHKTIEFRLQKHRLWDQIHRVDSLLALPLLSCFNIIKPANLSMWDAKYLVKRLLTQFWLGKDWLSKL